MFCEIFGRTSCPRFPESMRRIRREDCAMFCEIFGRTSCPRFPESVRRISRLKIQVARWIRKVNLHGSSRMSDPVPR